MSKQFASSTIKMYVMALLLLTAWGVQSVQVAAMENPVPQESVAVCCQAADEVEENTSADGISSGNAYSAEMAGCVDQGSQHCGMDGKSCQSVCVDCPAAIVDASVSPKIVDDVSFAALSPAAIAALDPIDHPPKRVFSL
jgi:hypothetical protein